MSKFVDSHCHLNRIALDKLGLSFDQMIDKTFEDGVSKILSVAVSLEEIPQIREYAQKYDDIYYSVGKHPSDEDGEEPSIDRLVDLAKDEKCIAIGESGLDYYYNDEETCSSWQRERFEVHLEAANIVNKPLIVHTRNAKDDTLAILKSSNIEKCGGILHCFTESYEMAKAAIDMGMYISFSGILTFKNAQDLRDTAAKLPLDRLLVETDSPYLTPDPYRGKPNYPRHTKYVVDTLAMIKSCTFDEVAQQTTKNFNKLFKL